MPVWAGIGMLGVVGLLGYKLWEAQKSKKA